MGSWLLLQNNATLWPKLQAETIDIPFRLSLVRLSKFIIGHHALPIGLTQRQNIKAIEYENSSGKKSLQNHNSIPLYSMLSMISDNLQLNA